MNLLLLEPEELAADEITLYGRRAAHLLNVLHVTVGSRVRLGVIGGPKGEGEIMAVYKDSLRLRAALNGPLPKPPPFELILALPRPIMLGRVFKLAAVMGVRRLHLVRSQKVEKSFFASPVLAPEKVRAALLAGLEQAMDTFLPEVCLYRHFKPFVEGVLPGLSGYGCIAHPDASKTLEDAFQQPPPGHPLLLAVGPEGGWSDDEVQAFEARGFTRFSMGPRILHVDTAVVALLAQLDLLRRMRERRAETFA